MKSPEKIFRHDIAFSYTGTLLSFCYLSLFPALKKNQVDYLNGAVCRLIIFGYRPDEADELRLNDRNTPSPVRFNSYYIYPPLSCFSVLLRQFRGSP